MACDVIKHLQLVFVELPKFPVHSPQEKKLRLLWLRFLREINEKTVTVSQELLDVPEISEAIVLSEEAAYSPGELSAYETYWDSVRTEKTLLIGKYDEGIAKGKAEGLAEGEAKGMEKMRREIAKNQLGRGASVDVVVEDTGLTHEEVEAIKASIDA